MTLLTRLLQSVENRLIEENAALGKERAHLADLMRNLQTMQNELERSGSESRRRLEDQVARLESQACVFSCSRPGEVITDEFAGQGRVEGEARSEEHTSELQSQ